MGLRRIARRAAVRKTRRWVRRPSTTTQLRKKQARKAQAQVEQQERQWWS